MALGVSKTQLASFTHSSTRQLAAKPPSSHARRCHHKLSCTKQQQAVEKLEHACLEPRAQEQQQRQQKHQTPGLSPQQGVTAAMAVLAAAALLQPDPAAALTIHAEPSNALSLPTWAIHVSSVTEWVVAMALFWKYAEVTGNERWKGMTWGMMPSLGSAMAACTWHFFYNSPDLDFLVALQAFLTVVGNCTCWIAAYRIYTAAQAEQPTS